MTKALLYPLVLTADDNGTLLVTCPDLPEVTTFGADRDDALAHAADAIEEAIAARIAARQDVPLPKARRRGMAVALPTQVVLKVLLYRAMRDARLSKAALARRLGVHGPQVDRLLDLNHASRLDQMEAALAALGQRIVVDVEKAA